jgi:hypothetical protein
MDEFVERQIAQFRFQITDYREGRLSLSSLIWRIETLARGIGMSFWEERVSPIAYDLELINSESIDKKREVSTNERQDIERLLQSLEKLASNDR